MSEGTNANPRQNCSTISGYHLYRLPDLGSLRFSLVDYRDTAEILNCHLLLGYGGVGLLGGDGGGQALPAAERSHTFDAFPHVHFAAFSLFAVL